jgi:hypothetical protein
MAGFVTADKNIMRTSWLRANLLTDAIHPTSILEQPRPEEARPDWRPAEPLPLLPDAHLDLYDHGHDYP